MWPKFPDICLKIDEKFQDKPQPRNLPTWGSNPEPLDECQ